MIRRGKHQTEYATVPNALANDVRLSFEARGLLVYLLTKPENWCVRVADLCKQGNIGRNKAYRLLTDLEEAGYLLRERSRDESGQLGEVDYIVFDQPNMQDEPRPQNQHMVGSPRPQNPDVDNPRVENGHHTKDRDSTNTGEVKNTEPPLELFPEASKPKRKSHLPPECPSSEDREKAKAYWTSKERTDLCARVDVIADGFRAHHEGKGSLALDWAATWRTWYVNQINYTRAPVSYQPRPGAPRAPSGSPLSDRERWQKRLDAWLDQGFWSGDWGPPPDKKGCEAPADLVDHTLKRRRIPA